jgi:hypothetical protein
MQEVMPPALTTYNMFSFTAAPRCIEHQEQLAFLALTLKEFTEDEIRGYQKGQPIDFARVHGILACNKQQLYLGLGDPDPAQCSCQMPST